MRALLINRSTTIFIVAGLAIGLALVMVVGPFASSSPDGLEKVSAQEGFDTATAHDLSDSPLADYAVDGVDDERSSTALAGAVGVTVTFAGGVGVFLLSRRRGGDAGGAVRPRSK